MISWVGDSIGHFNGIIINPSTYAYTSVALANAVQAVSDVIPIYEVHLSKSSSKDEFRQKSLISEVCSAHFEGQKDNDYDKHVYAYALDHMVEEVLKRQAVEGAQQAVRAGNAIPMFNAKAG